MMKGLSMANICRKGEYNDMPQQSWLIQYCEDEIHVLAHCVCCILQLCFIPTALLCQTVLRRYLATVVFMLVHMIEKFNFSLHNRRQYLTGICTERKLYNITIMPNRFLVIWNKKYHRCTLCIVSCIQVYMHRYTSIIKHASI